MRQIWTTEQIKKLLITLLCGVSGGGESRWALVIGDIERHPMVNDILCNWTVNPKGTTRERAAIAKAVEIVRAEHPYVIAE